jgi:hypothetical protein
MRRLHVAGKRRLISDGGVLPGEHSGDAATLIHVCAVAAVVSCQGRFICWPDTTVGMALDRHRIGAWSLRLSREAARLQPRELIRELIPGKCKICITQRTNQKRAYRTTAFWPAGVMPNTRGLLPQGPLFL